MISLIVAPIVVPAILWQRVPAERRRFSAANANGTSLLNFGLMSAPSWLNLTSHSLKAISRSQGHSLYLDLMGTRAVTIPIVRRGMLMIDVTSQRLMTVAFFIIVCGLNAAAQGRQGCTVVTLSDPPRDVGSAAPA